MKPKSSKQKLRLRPKKITEEERFIFEQYLKHQTTYHQFLLGSAVAGMGSSYAFLLKPEISAVGATLLLISVLGFSVSCFLLMAIFKVNALLTLKLNKNSVETIISKFQEKLEKIEFTITSLIVFSFSINFIHLGFLIFEKLSK